MRADDPKPTLGRRRISRNPGDQRTPADDVAPSRDRLAGPGCTLVECEEAGRSEARLGIRNGVVGRWRRAKVREQIIQRRRHAMKYTTPSLG